VKRLNGAGRDADLWVCPTTTLPMLPGQSPLQRLVCWAPNSYEYPLGETSHWGMKALLRREYIGLHQPGNEWCEKAKESRRGRSKLQTDGHEVETREEGGQQSREYFLPKGEK
jgi:hypothetical protein